MITIEILILVLLLALVFYRSTNGFDFDLVEIKSWEYSTKEKFYLVEFKWDSAGSTLQGFLVSDEAPSKDGKYVVGGFDASKNMWHIIKKKSI